MEFPRVLLEAYKQMRVQNPRAREFGINYDELESKALEYFNAWCPDYIKYLTDLNKEFEQFDFGQPLDWIVHNLNERTSELFFDCMCVKVIGRKERVLELAGEELQHRLMRRLNSFDLFNIYRYLCKRPNINALDISYNNLNSSDAIILALIVHGVKTVKHYNLMGNDITDEGLKYLIQFCESDIVTLRLSGNPIGDKGLRALGGMLSCTVALQHLDIGQVSASIQGIRNIAWGLARCYGQNQSLKVLDMSRILGYGCYLAPDHYIGEFAEQLFRLNDHLVELHLEKNSLCDHDIEIMALSLDRLKSLELLDLSANNIGDHGVELLMNVVPHTNIKALMLGHNVIRDSGARVICLKMPFSKIELLDISHNQIGDQGFINLLYTIKKPYPLLALFVWGNEFHEQKTLKLIKYFLMTGELLERALDIRLYEVDGELRYGEHDSANRYRNNYYGVSRTAVPDPGRFKRRTPPSFNAIFNYQHHNVLYHVPIQRALQASRPTPQPYLYPHVCAD